MDMNNTTTPESEQDCAQTPWWFIKSLQNFTNMIIELDVCAAPNTAKCETFYSLENDQDAFNLPWKRINFCNPPYSDIAPWIKEATSEAWIGNITMMLIPDKPEVGYTRLAREYADTVIHMPFRLGFLRPDGSEFLDKNGKKQGSKFPVCIYIFTPQGLRMPIRDIYQDFRIGYKQ